MVLWAARAWHNSGPCDRHQISCVEINERVLAHLGAAHPGRGQRVGVSARPFLFVTDGNMGGVNGDRDITEADNGEPRI